MPSETRAPSSSGPLKISPLLDKRRLLQVLYLQFRKGEKEGWEFRETKEERVPFTEAGLSQESAVAFCFICLTRFGEVWQVESFVFRTL